MAGIDEKDIEVISHGTTVATNITIAHIGAETGFMTSKGFRDIFHIGPHEPLKPSYQWTKGQSCINFSIWTTQVGLFNPEEAKLFQVLDSELSELLKQTPSSI